jgi:hypothetical protein
VLCTTWLMVCNIAFIVVDIVSICCCCIVCMTPVTPSCLDWVLHTSRSCLYRAHRTEKHFPHTMHLCSVPVERERSLTSFNSLSRSLCATSTSPCALHTSFRCRCCRRLFSRSVAKPQRLQVYIIGATAHDVCCVALDV